MQPPCSANLRKEQNLKITPSSPRPCTVHSSIIWHAKSPETQGALAIHARQHLDYTPNVGLGIDVGWLKKVSNRVTRFAAHIRERRPLLADFPRVSAELLPESANVGAAKRQHCLLWVYEHVSWQNKKSIFRKESGSMLAHPELLSRRTYSFKDNSEEFTTTRVPWLLGGRSDPKRGMILGWWKTIWEVINPKHSCRTHFAVFCPTFGLG